MDKKYKHISVIQNIKRGTVYVVHLSVNKKLKNLGTFDTLEEALKVRDEALKKRETIKIECKKPQAYKKYPDLTGMTFGKLTVIEKSKERIHGEICWRCVCTCGKEKTVSSHNLWHGKIVSCGCRGTTTEKNSAISIGSVFGRLTVTKVSDKRIRGQFSWDCLCDCGNKTTATNEELITGRKKSCGCLPKGRKKK